MPEYSSLEAEEDKDEEGDGEEHSCSLNSSDNVSGDNVYNLNDPPPLATPTGFFDSSSAT